jgi:hypothetical protein
MKLMRAGIFSAIVALTLFASVPAMADPPPASNPNTSVFTFDCRRGSETRMFQAIAIFQSAAIAGQLLDGNSVIVFTHIEDDGQVVFDVPGQRGRPDLWTCTIEGAPGAVVIARLTPRR